MQQKVQIRCANTNFTDIKYYVYLGKEVFAK